MRTVWLNGALVHPDAAAVSIDSPLTRWGDALFETMRAEGGRVRFKVSHLDRITASGRALQLRLAPREELARAVDAACAAGGAEHQRVRLTAAEDLVLVEAEDLSPLGAPEVATAAVIRGAWIPRRMMAEHKTTSHADYRRAGRGAAAAGAEIALLADERGHIGEADVGNVMAGVDGELVTPPVRGLLPGIARGALLTAGLAREGELAPELLERASELLATNAVRGVVALRGMGSEPWSRNSPGPLARTAQSAFAELG